MLYVPGKPLIAGRETLWLRRRKDGKFVRASVTNINSEWKKFVGLEITTDQNKWKKIKFRNPQISF